MVLWLVLEFTGVVSLMLSGFEPGVMARFVRFGKRLTRIALGLRDRISIARAHWNEPLLNRVRISLNDEAEHSAVACAASFKGSDFENTFLGIIR